MAYGGTNEAWIVGAVRTPIGRHGGSLSGVRPDDLGAVVLEALIERTGVPPNEVEDVYVGCANGPKRTTATSRECRSFWQASPRGWVARR